MFGFGFAFLGVVGLIGFIGLIGFMGVAIDPIKPISTYPTYSPLYKDIKKSEKTAKDFPAFFTKWPVISHICRASRRIRGSKRASFAV